MRNFKVKTTVAQDFNDNVSGITYEKNEPITLDRARYEELYAKGYVEKGEEIKEKKNEEKKEKSEE